MTSSTQFWLRAVPLGSFQCLFDFMGYIFKKFSLFFSNFNAKNVYHISLLALVLLLLLSVMLRVLSHLNTE